MFRSPVGERDLRFCCDFQLGSRTCRESRGENKHVNASERRKRRATRCATVRWFIDFRNSLNLFLLGKLQAWNFWFLQKLANRLTRGGERVRGREISRTEIQVARNWKFQLRDRPSGREREQFECGLVLLTQVCNWKLSNALKTLSHSLLTDVVRNKYIAGFLDLQLVTAGQLADWTPACGSALR